MNQIPAGRSQLHAEFDWVGTYDPTPLLALPTAIDFLESLHPGGLAELMRTNHEKALAARQILCESLSIEEPTPESMLGSMAAVPLPIQDIKQADELHRILREQRFEVPVFEACGHPILRVSMQAYNTLDQVERLAETLKEFV